MALFAALIFAVVTTLAFLFEGVAADLWVEPEIMDQRSEPAVVYGGSQDAVGREFDECDECDDQGQHEGPVDAIHPKQAIQVLGQAARPC